MLYARTEFEIISCHLQHEYGGYQLTKMTPTTETNKCGMCGNNVHLECDRFMHIKKGHIYICPFCKNVDPRTGKVRAKARARHGVK